MIVRTIVAGALVISCSPASIAGQVSCNLVRDASGDVRVYGTGSPAPAATSVDLVSADIASSRRRITAVFRVNSLRDPVPLPGAELSTTRGYWLTFPGEGGTWLFEAYLDGASPPRAIDGLVGFGQLGVYYWVPAAVSVDVARSEVRVTASLVAVSSLGKLPRTVGPFDVQAARQGTVAIVSVGAIDDQAHSAARYRLGAPSCVRP